MSRDSPCQCTLISVLRSGWFDFAIRYSMVYPPLMPAISPACLEAFVLAAGICLTAAFFYPQKKDSEPPAKMLLGCPKKKEKTDAWAAQARKEVASQPRGHLTTQRQMPIGRGMCPHQISCSNSSACTPFSCSRIDLLFAELRSRG
jgi:hypothetical protein